MDISSHAFSKFDKHLSIFKDVPVRFLEVGSYRGVSAQYLLDNFLTHPESHLDIIEPCHQPSPYSVGDNNKTLIDNLQAYPNVNIITKKSRYMGALEEDTYDFVYLDGSHKNPFVLEDCISAFHVLKIGGLCGIDDHSHYFIEVIQNVNIFTLLYQSYIDIVAVESLDHTPGSIIQLWFRKTKRPLDY